MTGNEIDIKLVEPNEKNILSVLELLKSSGYGVAGLSVPLDKKNVELLLKEKKVLSMERRDNSDNIIFGIAIPYVIDESNDFGLYGVFFALGDARESTRSLSRAIVSLKDFLFCQKLTKIGILVPRSLEMIEVMAKIRQYGFKQETILRTYFKTPDGFIDGILMDITADDRKIAATDESLCMSGLMPDKEKVREAIELVPELDMSKKQRILLVAILENSGKRHIELASLIGTDHSYVSELCQVLSEKGFVIQVNDEKDCRNKHVYPITEAIINRANALKNVMPPEKISAEEIQRLKNLFLERLKSLEINYRPQRMNKMKAAIEILANRYGQIITIEMLAKDLHCSMQSARDAIKIFVKTRTIKAGFKGINGKAVKVVQLIPEKEQVR